MPPLLHFAVRLPLVLAWLGIGWGLVASQQIAAQTKPASPAKTSAAEAERQYLSQIVPFLKTYCLECHGPAKQESEVAFHKYKTAAAIQADAKTWEVALQMLRTGAMPPDDRPQPKAAERKAVADWLERAIYYFDCDAAPDPGRVTVRRLNRAEYNNTVRDLLGVNFRPADDFPSDDVGAGFDNQGDVLSLPPLLLEKYLDAAERIAAEAIIANPQQIQQSRSQVRELKGEGAATRERGEWSIISRGGVSGQFDLPRDGRYLLRARAGATKAGDEAAAMEFAVDGKKLKVFSVNAARESPREYELPLDLKRGRRTFSIEFINDFYDENAKDRSRRDRNLYIRYLDIVGPLDLQPEDFPPSHRKLLAQLPPSGSKNSDTVREAARTNLRPFLQRAFRRRVEPAEVDLFAGLAAQRVAAGESFEQGMQAALQAVLVSPHFLFRIERDPRPDDPKAAHDLGQYELASRLSYFLWSSLPDDELFLLATQGKLNDERVLRQQVRRMLADPRSETLTENFAMQWLNLRLLDGATPDATKFREFNSALKQDLRRETEMFFSAVVKEDRSVLDFLTGDFTFVNQRLAQHYGLEGVAGDDFQRIALPPGRSGVLTHGSVLTLTSNPGRTSPVKRGKWIMENLLGSPPPDPPPDAPQLDATQKSQPNVSLRKQLEIHRQNPVCASCHKTMDQLGFGLENFDAIGRWRDADGKLPIDASGELPEGDRFRGPKELAGVLLKKRADFTRCLSEKLLSYSLGRQLERFDRCAVDKIILALEKEEYRFSVLATEIVLSDPFRRRRGEGADSK